MEATLTAWPIFPCHWIEAGKCSCGHDDCHSPGKHPLTANGLKDATSDPETIEHWRQKWPKANWAVRTGDGLVVIDIDRKSGGFDSLLELEETHGRPPATFEVVTGGGGRHLYYIYPKGENIASRNGWRPGIDVKADGGYVIQAGAVHASGNRYYPDGDNEEIVVSPDWLLARLPHKGEAPKHETNGHASNGQAPPSVLQRAESYVAKAAAASEGQRNDAAFRLAGSVAAIEGEHGERLGEGEIFTLLSGWNLRNSPPLHDGELRQCVQSALVNGTARAAKPAAEKRSTAGGGEELSGGNRRLTDVGNCERFAEQHGEDVRYCHKWRKWLVWDGRRWAIDESGSVMRLAKRTMRGIYIEAANASDKEQAQLLARHAAASERKERVAAAIALAESEQPIPIAVDSLDADPWLLDCENGTIDLRTGELREHRREDYLTKLCPVEYPTAPVAPKLWLSVLTRNLGGNVELVQFLQRFFGMALVGEVRDHVLLLCLGPGANGKSLTLETVCGVLGSDYAMQAPADLLMVRKGERHPTELADLHGKRFVAAVESSEGGRLSETLVKQLTGGDSIRARRMREDFWQFRPSHTVALATNHKPTIRGTDHAIWRRIRLLKFNVTIPEHEQDKQLAVKLRGEYPAILRWCVEGCLAWQRYGLQSPAEVMAATEEYRASEDTLGEFISEICTVAPQYDCQAGVLYGHYKDWATKRGEDVITQTAFGARLVERGFAKDRPTSGPNRKKTIYIGLAVLASCP